MNKWYLIQNQSLLLREIFKEPRLISYKKGESLQDILVRAKVSREITFHTTIPCTYESCLACQLSLVYIESKTILIQFKWKHYTGILEPLVYSLFSFYIVPSIFILLF